MDRSQSVKLKKIIEKFGLEVLRGPEGYGDRLITTEDVSRPGLQLTGFFDYFADERLQLIGLVETTYLNKLTSQQRLERFDALFAHDFPALIFSRGIEPHPECMEMAQRHNTIILRTQEASSSFTSSLISYLKNVLAPCITRHGVLLDIYGEGVLILGESGVGKSETAIELVKRGHRLIADDAVEIRRTANNQLEGTAPELIRHYIELRGIGVVDVRRLFGMSAIKLESDINMVINLEQWNDNTVYDRLGADDLYTSILGVQVPTLTIPVKPGRNLAIIIEVAAMNNRNKKMGYNAALDFTRRVNAHFDRALADPDSVGNF